MLFVKSVINYNYLLCVNEYLICFYYIENKEQYIYILVILNGLQEEFYFFNIKEYGLEVLLFVLFNL